ncbi:MULTISPECIES: flagellar basal body-associated FliL family protein [Rhizobium/Agrobacterium group]|uniref:flagellar basal body-associated FliL family protein n=1 Tax=Rhizobium/Agrobacterium group TaxID=227290 RepID=UPI00110D8E12|nr:MULTISPECIES: flagellar basal body-associated FliL family protein [Rhizobium/Agrobacterium group]NWJ24893.1 flagellar basal body-associated FliL family protein [Rhizobium sp. RM]TMV16679.1 flagellar basal body-associated FliL family protein [Rhizobium sp. Td3]UXS00278.1 flagellar basal body-associated FliL family protein [Agrobacterium tumefaciens]
MLKLLLTGVWVCAVTLGAVYFSVQMATAPAPVDEAEAKKANLQLVKGESITIPVINDGGVNGYFLSRISLRVDKQKIAKIELPATQLVTDELFTLLAGSSMVNIANVSTFDPEAFKQHIREGLNGKLGEEIVEDVLIEQLDYLSKADIRAQTGNGSPRSIKIVEGEKVEAEPAAAAGH